MTEKERRFEFKGTRDDYEFFETKLLILQGYFNYSENNHTRVRIESDIYGNLKSTLTLKSKTDEITIRNEFEIDIPIDDAFEIVRHCEFVVLKNRYVEDGLVVDEFINTGRIIVEVEDDSKISDDNNEILGKEITHINVSFEEATLNCDVEKCIESFNKLVKQFRCRRVKEDWMALDQFQIDILDDIHWGHYMNKGCICHAHDKSECVCGAWWVE